MKKAIFYTILTVALPTFAAAVHSNSVSVHSPNFKNTPGLPCSTADKDFSGLDYPEQIARCNRNILDSEKAAVSAIYGNIPKSDWPQYEFDHLLPICAGGSNNSDNLWPQPIAEAKKKDVLEVDICLAMKAGALKQSDAVQKIYDWFKQ